MTTTDLLKFHESFCAEARAIMAAKNHDYAGADGTTPFANFESVESIGLCSTETGFVVRILDKVKRLTTFCTAGVLKVKNEGPRDALMDILNYVILMAAYIHYKARAKEAATPPITIYSPPEHEDYAERAAAAVIIGEAQE